MRSINGNRHPALRSAADTTGHERGFSVRNKILTPLRNYLTVDVQHKLIKVWVEKEMNSDLMMHWKNGSKAKIGTSMS